MVSTDHLQHTMVLIHTISVLMVNLQRIRATTSPRRLVANQRPLNLSTPPFTHQAEASTTINHDLNHQHPGYPPTFSPTFTSPKPSAQPSPASTFSPSFSPTFSPTFSNCSASSLAAAVRISSVGFVAFQDEDLDALQIGGTVYWGPPPDITYNQARWSRWRVGWLNPSDGGCWNPSWFS